MSSMVRDRSSIQRCCLLLICVLAFVSIAFHQSAVAAGAAELELSAGTEQLLRSAIVKSVEGEVAGICKDMFREPPSVSVTADLSEVLRAFPENLATSPTVRCHRVPCIAITSDNWAHLADVYAKSDEGVRRIALEVNLSKEEDAMTVASASVKSVDDYACPRVSPAMNGKQKFKFNLCGVRLSLEPSQTYVVDIGARRLGVVFDGGGELKLEPTCAKSLRMLGDFVPEPDRPITVSRVFITCPFEEQNREPRQVKRIRRLVGKLNKTTISESSHKTTEAMERFLGDCVKSAYPTTDEDALQGQAPLVGYEHPMLVVQTEELGTFGFCFAGERGSETVMMTSPWTCAPVSYWESRGRKHEWAIPCAEEYAFHVTWHPERRRVDVECDVVLSGVDSGRDIRFILSPGCKVRSCKVNGKKTPFAQGPFSMEESIASALLCNYHPMFIQGLLQLSPPKGQITGGEANASIEYSIDYEGAPAIEEFDAGLFCTDMLSFNGHCQWFPFTQFKSKPRRVTKTTYEIEVPTGFTAVAQGNPQPAETKNDVTIWRYVADFPTVIPSLSIGRFEEFTDDAFEPKLASYTRLGETVGRRWVEALGMAVAWAEKYCGKYPYKRFAVVEATPGDNGSISWATMLTATCCMMDPLWLWWTLSHEVTHQWWGDAATMLDIDDVWLHEGAATYFSMLFNEDLHMRNPGVPSFSKAAAFVKRFGPSPPISAGFRMGERFGKVFYGKGCCVFNMLRMATNNDRHFFATLKQFQQASQKTGLTEAGLKAAFEKAIGHDLSDFFRLYVHTGDLPGVQAAVTDVRMEGDQATISLSAQITPGGYQLPYPIDVFRKSGLAPHREVIFIGPDAGEYEFEVPFADISRIVGNPDAMLLVADAEQEDVELYIAPE